MSNEMNLPLGASRTGMLRDSRGVVIGDIFFPDKAAHIVKCANAHDGLVEALQSILDMCNEDSHARDYASRQTEIRGTAIVALRKAQGDQDGTR